jgi:hypothetical protein
LNRALTKEEVDGLIGHKKIIFVLAFSSWTDGAGRHELERCEYILNNPTPTTVSGRQCVTHTGLQKVAKD